MLKIDNAIEGMEAAAAALVARAELLAATETIGGREYQRRLLLAEARTYARRVNLVTRVRK